MPSFQDLFVFEIANNHGGSVAHAQYIIDKLSETTRRHSINAAVKFQYRDLDTLIHPDYRNSTENKHILRFNSTRLTSDEFYGLVSYVKEREMIAICTPFDENSVSLCEDHGIDIIKIASCSATDYPLLERVSKSQKPVIVSTGGKSIAEIDNIYNFFVHRDVNFAFLHCIGIYPAQNSQLQLNCIERMINRYPEITVGYSGHEEPDNTLVAQMAVAKGAKIFERHVGHATGEISLNAYSTEVDDIEQWVFAVIEAQNICGDKNKKSISEVETKSLRELSRGCFCAKPVRKGDVITRDSVFFAMPCNSGQTTSGQYQENMIASKNYEAGEEVIEKRKTSIITDTRSIIHDIKGMLFESKVVIGKDFELELSHHYGMEHFRSVGATVISIVNREYCKKIVIVLPGQKHPMHYHKLKEETFQVLSGVLNIQLESEIFYIHPGEILTVERGVRHAFTSVDGCIFEEISTTHKINDSFYDDPGVLKIDVMNRKTILKEW